MSKYLVKVKTETEHFQYATIGRSSLDIAADAIDLFGVCAVTVIAL
jgi:hypothetical protein